MIITVCCGSVSATIDTEYQSSPSPEGVEMMLKQCVSAAVEGWQQKKATQFVMNEGVGDGSAGKAEG